LPAAISSRQPQALMKAAVYTGNGQISVQSIPVPEIGPGELLVRVESCGICHTDLKKIHNDLLPPPRVYGHETAGVVEQVGDRVTRFRPGDRVVAFHHIPCLDCFYCNRKLYAQCALYKKVGITAGYEPAGGGFAQYVRVMDWIVERGLEKIPPEVSFDAASFVEPVNTCLKAIAQAGPEAGDSVLIQGQGPIGLIFTMLARRIGCSVLVTDRIAGRRELARRFGAAEAWDPARHAVAEEVRARTGGRGADLVIVAASAKGLVSEAIQSSRPGSKILLFAQTSHAESISISGADICVGERQLIGSYSASVDLQKESAELVFSGQLPVEEVISHRVPLPDLSLGIERALHPADGSMKIIVQPQRW